MLQREHPPPMRRKLTSSLTFSRLSGDDEWPCTEFPQQTSAAQAATSTDAVDDNDVNQKGFEFAFVVRAPKTFSPNAVDEKFPDVQTLPIYPVFNRSLLIDDGNGSARRTLFSLVNEERDCSSSSSFSSSRGDDLQGIPSWTYCIWTPGAERERKRCPKGSSLWWRIRNVVVGGILCNGKEKFLFLTAKGNGSPEKVAPTAAVNRAKEKWSRNKAAEVDLITDHRVHHRQGGHAMATTRGAAGSRPC